MSRTKGYKCFNIKCGSCIGKTLCGEPEDTALGCVGRVIGKPMTNADRIRAMSDEEMAVFLYEWSPSECCGHVCPRLRDDIPCKGECFEMRREWLQQPCDGGDNA